MACGVDMHRVIGVIRDVQLESRVVCKECVTVSNVSRKEEIKKFGIDICLDILSMNVHVGGRLINFHYYYRFIYNLQFY